MATPSCCGEELRRSHCVGGKTLQTRFLLIQQTCTPFDTPIILRSVRLVEPKRMRQRPAHPACVACRTFERHEQLWPHLRPET